MNYFRRLPPLSIFLFSTIPLFCLEFCTKSAPEKESKIQYPTLKTNSVSDNYFGKIVGDKYRILENLQDNKVRQWLLKERILCDSILNKISFRDSLQYKIQDAIYSSNVTGGFPRTAEKKLFFSRTYVKENIQKLYYKDSLNAEEVELFSTITLNKKSEVFNVDYFEPSFDGKYLAFGISSNGGEMTVMKIIDVEKKLLLPESIDRATYGEPFWIPHKNAFFYAQLKEIKSDADSKTMYENSVVKLHLVGTDQRLDKEVFSSTLNKELKLDAIDFSTIYTFPNSDKAFALTQHGATPYISLFMSSLNDFVGQSPSNKVKWKNVCTSDEKATSFVSNNNQLYLLCFKDNPNGSIKKYELSDCRSPAKTILDGKDYVLEEMIQTHNAIYVKTLKNGISSIFKIDLLTETIEKINLPFNGYVYLKPFFDVPPASLHSQNLLFALQSWDKEAGIYLYNSESKKVIKTDLRAQGKYGNRNDLVIKEVEIPSHDGVLVPLSIIYLKSTKLNGENPTLLEAYGSYGVSMNAEFSLPLQVWLNMGGVCAIAHVRGGGEKGDAWYKGGYQSTKPNSWKDFIACAEYLIKNKYTSTKKLSAKGVSAGCITVGRAITERPDLFKAAILDVGVLNSLRFEKSHNTINVSEFGTTNDSIGFRNLFEMDVYHHIDAKKVYPSLLITGGLNDARVDLWQPAKAVARFQEVSANKNNVVLFKISDFGHSGNLDKVREETDNYSFLFWQLNHPKFILN